MYSSCLKFAAAVWQKSATFCTSYWFDRRCLLVKLRRILVTFYGAVD